MYRVVKKMSSKPSIVFKKNFIQLLSMYGKEPIINDTFFLDKNMPIFKTNNCFLFSVSLKSLSIFLFKIRPK